jgi:methylphosphotriester-DNA--protein-cysteine methyltransferase
MLLHKDIGEKALRKEIRQASLTLAGNTRLKIFGQFNCRSGKKMKKQNRIFFINAEEAIACGFRPCGHCMKAFYKHWKDELI